MARVTKAMLEENLIYVRSVNKQLRGSLELVQKELEMTKKFISLYQGTSSLIIANERISDALSHTVNVMRSKTDKYL